MYENKHNYEYDSHSKAEYHYKITAYPLLQIYKVRKVTKFSVKFQNSYAVLISLQMFFIVNL